MKMVEIRYASYVKDLEKLEARLERQKKALVKAEAKAEKLGVAAWTWEEWRAWLDNDVETNNGWIVNKSDIDKNGAWRARFSAQKDIEETEGAIERLTKRLEKAEDEVEAYHKEIEAIEDLKKKEELRKLEFEQEVKEWAKDGITLEARYYGKTPSGKFFYISGNCGFTLRSRHCVTLTIGGNTIFTSGEFWRAYNYIKNS